MRVNWQELKVGPILKYCQEYFELWKDFPSVRDLFYRFVDELWANTRSHYNGLSKWLVKQRLAGALDWHLVRDGGGRERNVGDWPLLSVKRFLQIQDSFIGQSQLEYRLPIWHEQETEVIVLLEKEADFPPVKTICRELGVDVLYMRGYPGWRIWFELAEEFKETERDLVFIVIIDFDPSGQDIARFCERALQQVGLKCSVERALLTKEQIEKFKLPHRPEDSKEIEKLRKDPRFKSWPWGLYRVETAAFRAKAPEAFREAIENAVKLHFSEDIFDRTRDIEEERRSVISEYGIIDILEQARDVVQQAIEEQET